MDHRRSNAPLPPPDCGRRLLPNVIDERAQSQHTRPLYRIPRSNNIEDGFEDISYGIFANAVNRLTHWIRQNLGPPSRECEPITYIASADLRYQITVLAAVKAGYTTFLPSPRNSQHAFDALLKQCGTTTLLSSDPPPAAVTIIRKCDPDIKHYTIPSLEELLSETPVGHVSFDATWKECRHRPMLHIHSSGSTGVPKVVTLNHGSSSALDAFQTLEDNDVGRRYGDSNICPPFHSAGVVFTIAMACWTDFTVILPPPVPLTAAVVDAMHAKGDAHVTLLPPSLIIELARDPQYLHNLCQLRLVTFSGGPLPESTGKLIAEHTQLAAAYGASETTGVPQLPKAREDWAWMRFNDQEGGLEFKERDNGLFELIIRRKKIAKLERAQPVFATFPDIDEFETKDLFAPHPTKPGLWKYDSRMDDMLVLSNGEKLNPVVFEGVVGNSPDVKGCLVVGNRRFHPILMIEPQEPSADVDSITEKIWTYVEKANEEMIRHGRIARDCILLTSPDKPLPRAGKGTIQRAAANAAYADEIDALYQNLDAHDFSDKKQLSEAERLNLNSFDSTRTSLQHLLRYDMAIGEVRTDLDFFAIGMDSLQVVNMVRTINAARADKAPIDAKGVYDHPTIDSLAQFLHPVEEQKKKRHRLLQPPAPEDDDSDDEELKQSWLAMDKMYHDMTAKMEFGSEKKRRHNWLRAADDDQGPVIPPDGGSVAWLQVLAMFLVNVNNWGLVNSFGVFESFYSQNYLLGYSEFSIAWIGTLQGALLLLVGVVSGPLFDKGLFRPLLITASVGLVVGLMTLSLATRYYEIMLSQGLLCGLSSGLLYIPSVALVPVYFKRRRGLALGLATGGGAIGGVIYPVIFKALLQSTGFPWAVRVMGFIALATLSLAIALTKPLGPRTTRQLIDRSAFMEPYYLLLMGAAFFLLSAVFVPYFLAPSFLPNTTTSAYSLAILNAAQFLGRLIPAWHSDDKSTNINPGPESYLLLSEIALSILGFSWIAVTSQAAYIPWLIIYGFASGASVTLPAIVLPYICENMGIYGTRLGMLYGVSGVGFLISTPVAGALNGVSKGGNGFLGSQVWIGSCCAAAGVLFVGVGREVRRRRGCSEKGRRRRRDRGIANV